MSIKNKSKSMLSILLIATLIFASFGGTVVFASANTDVVRESTNSYYAKDAVFDTESQEYINKVVSVSEYYFFDKGVLKITLTKDTLINEYNFTEEEYEKLSSTVLNKKIDLGIYKVDSTVFPKAHIANATLYISNDDLHAGMFAVVATAASSGPAAMAAALTAISTAISGPIGTVISAIVAIAAGPSLIELCGRVTWALAANQGIYIKPVFSYPPLEIGYY